LSRTQRLVGWLACMTVAVCSVGVPLPAHSEKKPGAAPFPCQDCPCGCKDAETCWRDCCCYTNQQKLAWARRNRVTPPAFVVAAAKHEGCCEGNRAHACCEAKTASVGLAAVKRPCCAKPGAACASSTSQCAATRSCSQCDEHSTAADTPPPLTERRSPGTVLLISKLRCGGISLSVSMLPPSVVVKATGFALAVGGHFEPFVVADNLYEPPYLAVTAPPPDARGV
jgi:hypothetical protein